MSRNKLRLTPRTSGSPTGKHPGHVRDDKPGASLGRSRSARGRCCATEAGRERLAPRELKRLLEKSANFPLRGKALLGSKRNREPLGVQSQDPGPGLGGQFLGELIHASAGLDVEAPHAATHAARELVTGGTGVSVPRAQHAPRWPWSFLSGQSYSLPSFGPCGLLL